MVPALPCVACATVFPALNDCINNLNKSCSQDHCEKLLQGIVDQAAALGPLGDVIFVCTYALAVTLFIPASVLTLGAGGAYGTLHGTALASAGSTLGCALSFVVSRYLARPLAEERLKGNKLFQRLEKQVPERGAKLVLLLRLTPLVPFGLLNYMCGVPCCQSCYKPS